MKRHPALPWLALLAVSGAASAGEVRATRVAATSAPALAEWATRLERLTASGDLTERLAREDTLLPGRLHQRLQQRFRGVPVFGGELAVQTDGRETLTVFGTFYEGIDVEVAPRLRPIDAERAVASLGAHPFGLAPGPELVVLPLGPGGYRLAYRLRAAHRDGGFDIRQYFIDAATGSVVLQYSDLKPQAVGAATGVLSDRKKISTRQSGGTYVADDRLRPPVIATYDFKGDISKILGLQSVADLADFDLASDSDNDWNDGANVDAHVYAGYTYDYYFKRFNRRGLDNANIPLRSITHPVRREDFFSFPNNLYVGTFYLNAFYAGEGLMVYGEGLPEGLTTRDGKSWNYLAGALDVVGHELTHGVTDYSSLLDYRDESGALNESFSDIMGTSIEFYFEPAGAGSKQADYLIGEDVVTPGGLRSMQNPAAYGDPDHYSIRFLGSDDNGGVHINSGISNNAYYLAIEGGTHRLSRVAVQGVGVGNREQIEKAFYRAFTLMLPPSATFATARAASLQSARDLYGAGSAVERAVSQAWTAVGVE